IAAGARASGKPVWTLYASNEGHGFTRRENRDYEEAVTAAFLKKHLQDGETVGVRQAREGLPREGVELGITCREPRPIDVAAWVRTAKEAGAGYLVLPAEAFMTLALRLRQGSPTDLLKKTAATEEDTLLREIKDAVARPGPLAGLWIEGAGDALKRLGADAALARVHAPRAAVVLGNDGSVALGRNTGPHLESRASLRSGPSPHDGPEGLKPIEETILLHYQTVGRGANLLLELTPDARGGVLEAESARLHELTTELAERFARPVASSSGDGELIEVDLRGPRRIDHIVSRENLERGQRVERYVLEGRSEGAWSRIGSGTTIGRKKVDSFGPVVADLVRLRVLRSSGPPSFREVLAYDTGGAPRTRAGGGIPADELATALKALAEQKLDEALRGANRALSLAPAWTPAHRLRAEIGMARNDTEGVVKDLGVVLALEEPQGGLQHLRATALFKLGKFAESAAGFNAAVEAGGAHTSDACWERGLARYYAGDAEGARQQFEGYHHVGPLDIENGLWAFLSEARRGGSVEERLERARRALPEYRDRRRPPFPALLDLYLGKGTVEAVFEEARGKTAPGPARDEGIFYAHLYAGKYLEAAGDAAGARKHLEEAVRIPIDHFMALCAKAEVERFITGAR
ncbi:MAG TPA: hypothetical protein VMT52_07855, partial [Planctomycetota bacterium]|nr:hypothetical protein [Planctomycetota bacterium]